MRESSPPEAVSATGPNGSPAFGTDEEGGLVGARRTEIALPKLDEELALAEPEALELACDRAGERLRPCASLGTELLGERIHAGRGSGDRLAGGSGRIAPTRCCFELRARSRSALEQLAVGRAAEAALEIRDPLEAAFNVLEERGVGVEGRQEPVEVAADLAQPYSDVAQLARCRAELRREPLDRRERALGPCRERGRPLAVLGGNRRRRVGDSRSELGDVQQSLAPAAQVVLLPCFHPLGRLDQRLELGQPRGRTRSVARQLIVMASGGTQLTPSRRSFAPALELLLPAERVEDIELERGAREPPLLELPRHPDEALRRRGEILPRDGTPPRVRPRASVAEHAPREYEPGFALRP